MCDNVCVGVKGWEQFLYLRGREQTAASDEGYTGQQAQMAMMPKGHTAYGNCTVSENVNTPPCLMSVSPT